MVPPGNWFRHLIAFVFALHLCCPPLVSAERSLLCQEVSEQIAAGFPRGTFPKLEALSAEWKAILAKNGSHYYPRTARERELKAVHEAYEKLGNLAQLHREAESLRADTDAGMQRLAQEEAEAVARQIHAIAPEVKQTLLRAMDSNYGQPVIIEIRPEGPAADLLTADLVRMYQGLAKKRGWKIDVKLEASQRTDGHGYHSAVIRVDGAQAYEILRNEGGEHAAKFRENNGKPYTHRAQVTVAPARELPKISFKDADFTVEAVVGASGPGGQNVNKTATTAVVTHTPTGTVVRNNESRSLEDNTNKAKEILKAKITAAAIQEYREQLLKDRRAQTGLVRRYDLFDSAGVSVDNRTREARPTQSILNGDLDLYSRETLDDAALIRLLP